MSYVKNSLDTPSLWEVEDTVLWMRVSIFTGVIETKICVFC